MWNDRAYGESTRVDIQPLAEEQPMEALTESTQVLVVGAGPTGLSLAAALAVRGVDVAVVEKAAEMAGTSRAAVIHARTLEQLRVVGVDDELVDLGLIVPRFSVRDGDRALITIDFDGLPTNHPYTLMLSQDQTEKVLRQRLDELGVAVYQSCELASLEEGVDGVLAKMADGRTIKAGYVVGADGMNSVVRECAGIGFVGAAYAESFVLADVRLDWALSQ